MIRIVVITSDNKIWNQSEAYAEIVYAMSLHQPFEIDLFNEGPDLQSLGTYDFLTKFANKFNYPLNYITIYTANALERHAQINIVYSAPYHLLINAKEYITNATKSSRLKHFGMFIGRSNAPRLHLASYLKHRYSDQSVISYHFNLHDDFHTHNIGLEDLIKYYKQDIHVESNFLSCCPLRINNTAQVLIDKSLGINPAQQLLKNDKEYFLQTYRDFFVEIVCESFFTGNTFFTTEKIFRPILLKTPFIVQGPRNFLRNLKKLGFKTFDQWWDEGYSEDPTSHQLTEIKQVLDMLSKKSSKEIHNMYKSMHDVLEHNYQTALDLTDKDFYKLYE
jgi:hypothetical protein